MENKNTSKITERIKKLLALSSSPNENEAKAALLKAQALMAEHKLEQNDIDDIKTNPVVSKITGVSFTKAKWKARLANVIGDNFQCYTYFSTYITNTITFMGRKEDTNVAEAILLYAIKFIDSKVRKLRYNLYQQGYSAKGLEQDYAIGFIQGLKEGYENQIEEHQEWGLILVKDTEVVESFEAMEFTGIINSHMSYQGFSVAFIEGMVDGKEFSKAKQLDDANK